MATVRSTHHKLVSPKISFFYLSKNITHELITTYKDSDLLIINVVLKDYVFIHVAANKKRRPINDISQNMLTHCVYVAFKPRP